MPGSGGAKATRGDEAERSENGEEEKLLHAAERSGGTTRAHPGGRVRR